MLKILHARLQQYMNQEFPDVQAGFRISRGIRDQIAKIRWIIKKRQENSRKTTTSASLTYAEVFDCVHHNKLWQILKEMGVPDHLTCLLRSMYAGQEATVRNRYATMDWFQTGKGVLYIVTLLI